MGGVDSFHRQGHSDEDVKIYLRSPATSFSRPGRHAKPEFVVSHLGSSTKGSHKETERRKRMCHTNSQDESGSSDTAPPRPLHVGDTRLHRLGKAATPIARHNNGGLTAAIGWIRHPVVSTILGVMIVTFLLPWVFFQIINLTGPVCSVPVISPMIPFCHLGLFESQITSSSGQLVRRADYPRLVALQTKAFRRLLEERAGNDDLVLEAKRAEIASNDLITLVRVSDLGGKDQVTERLRQFVADTKGAGRSLHSIRAKIQGAVDS